jgi:hypothetical protein
MKQKLNHYFTKALYQAQIKELKQSHRKSGFRPIKIDKIAAEYFDLLMKHPKSGKIIAFQVNLFPFSDGELERIETAKDVATELGYNFRTITLIRQPPPELKINWLKPKLDEILRANPFGYFGFINSTAFEGQKFVALEEVEIVLDTIIIEDDKAEVVAEGTVEMRFQDLSDPEPILWSEPFSFKAEITLSLSQQDLIVKKWEVDTSLFY